MKYPTKLASSRTYRSYGILGALGLSDHGGARESDMAEMYAKEGGSRRMVGSKAGWGDFKMEKDPGVRWGDTTGEV